MTDQRTRSEEMAARRRRRRQKSDTAYRTISEAAEEVGVQQHVLRFWETRFSQLRPIKRAGGRRYYRPSDIALLKLIYKSLYEDGFTIKGVQKQLREGNLKVPDAEQESDQGQSASTSRPSLSQQTPHVDGRKGLTQKQKESLQSVLQDLYQARQLLDEEKQDQSGYAASPMTAS